jgi:peptidoglycan/xylan/chitin deacetylase (PgdA/CDA1 family)
VKPSTAIRCRGEERSRRREGSVSDSRLKRILRLGLTSAGSLIGVHTDDTVVAITFDDGPDPEFTPPLLDVLARHHVTATFFVLADRAQRHDEIVRRMVREGHEVALHGADHRRLTTLPPHAVLSRTRTAKSALQAITGTRVRWTRPPYGAQRVLTYAALRAARVDVVLWGGWVRDWEPRTVEDLLDRARSAIRPGGILLLHDAPNDEAVERGLVVDRVRFLDDLLTRLSDEDWLPCTVSALLEHGPPRLTFSFSD